jgi:nitroreductase
MKYESRRLKKIRGLIGNRYYKNYEQAEVASIGCAVENMWLTAQTLGLGMVWIMAGSGHIKKCARRFGVDGDVVAFLAIGYPDPSAQETKTSRKPLREICRFRPES